MKAPKAVTGGYQTLVAAITAFGPAICVPLQLFELFDKSMAQPHRNGFTDLFREIYKFIGPPFSSAATETSKLPLEFREELKKVFEKMSGSIDPLLEPSRLTRSAKLNPTSKKGATNAFSVVQEFSKMEPVDIFPKLVEAEKKVNSQLADKSEHLNFMRDLSGETEESRTMKWNKKVERLNVLHEVLKGTERHLVNNNYCDIIKILRKQYEFKSLVVLFKIG